MSDPSPNIRVESDAVKRRAVSGCLGAGAAHAGRYASKDSCVVSVPSVR